jgi:hypothetical protein
MSCDRMDRILATLKARVPGVTDELLSLELFNVLDRFFRRTNVWRYTSVTTLVEGVTRYDLFPPNDSELVRVMWAIQGDNTVQQVTLPGTGIISRGYIDADGAGATTGDPLYDPDRTTPPTSGPFRYMVYFPHYLEITIAPDEVATQTPFEIEMALSLQHRCLEKDCGDWGFPEWMYDRYANDWIEGMQYCLFSMIAKPWSNPVAAKYHASMFAKAMSQAKVEGEKGIVFNTQNWRFPNGGFVLRPRSGG